MLLRLPTLTAFACTAATACAQSPGLWLMGRPPGTSQGTATGLSEDGSVAVGWNATFSFPNATPSYTWTASGGRVDLTSPPFPVHTPVFAVSGDGGTVAGSRGDSQGPWIAFRRAGNDPLEDLGTFQWYTDTSPTSMSGDGDTIVGYGQWRIFNVPYTQAFRWTPAGGMQPLGWLGQGGPQTNSRADAVSRDGTTIVGSSQGGASGWQAFVWTEGTGMQGLPGLPAQPNASSSAIGVNADGSVIVGGTLSTGVVWTNSGIAALSAPAGVGAYTAWCVNDDGRAIAGAGAFAQGPRAVVWLDGTPSVLSELLASHGVTLAPGTELRDVSAISGDGLTFAGQAYILGAGLQGYVATIPAPPAAALLLASSPCLLRRRR